ncbi:hypothetical protein Emag_005402 [Eimeria magna]
MHAACMQYDFMGLDTGSIFLIRFNRGNTDLTSRATADRQQQQQTAAANSSSSSSRQQQDAATAANGIQVKLEI